MSELQVISSLVTGECCICLEIKDIVYTCVQCNESKLCDVCYSSIKNYSKKKPKCPVCRKKNWIVEKKSNLSIVHNCI